MIIFYYHIAFAQRSMITQFSPPTMSICLSVYLFVHLFLVKFENDLDVLFHKVDFCSWEVPKQQYLGKLKKKKTCNSRAKIYSNHIIYSRIREGIASPHRRCLADSWFIKCITIVIISKVNLSNRECVVKCCYTKVCDWPGITLSFVMLASRQIIPGVSSGLRLFRSVT